MLSGVEFSLSATAFKLLKPKCTDGHLTFIYLVWSLCVWPLFDILVFTVFIFYISFCFSVLSLYAEHTSIGTVKLKHSSSVTTIKAFWVEKDFKKYMIFIYLYWIVTCTYSSCNVIKMVIDLTFNIICQYYTVIIDFDHKEIHTGGIWIDFWKFHF